MEEIEKYRFREKNGGEFNYYFDKFTSFFSKNNFKEIKNPKKILFIRNDHLGDMVYATTIFREVKKFFPKCKIFVIATESNREIIEKDKNVDEIIEIDLFWRRKNFQALKDYFKVFRKIRKEKFDAGIDLRRSKLNMFFFLFLPKIPNRISYYNINGGKSFLTHPVLYDKKTHIIKEHVNLVNKAFGIKIKNILPKISVDEEDKNIVEKFIRKNKINEYVVFAPGATSDTKRWPENKFNELISEFHKKFPKYKVLISGSEGDKNMIDFLRKDRDFCIPLINFNLRRMSLIFKNAKVVVANDGVGTDLSWVSGGKLVQLSGPVDREIFGPLKNTKIIYHDIPCKGKKISCPCDWAKPCKRPCNIWCMDLINVKEVLQAIEEFIKKTKLKVVS